MGDLGITVRVYDKLQYFEHVIQRARDPTRLFMRVGQLLVNASRQAFAVQSYGGKAWKPRHVPNVLGVVRDLERGASVGEHRFQPRPALVDTGDLQRSVAWSLVPPNAVRVTASAPYAALQNNGGVSSRTVTQTVKSNLAIYLRAHPDRRPLLGFLFRRATVSTVVPARPFLGVTPLLQAQINTAVKDFVLARGEYKKA